MRCIQASSESRNENTMIAIATIRLKLTSTAAMLTVERRAVPRSWADATWQPGRPAERQPPERELRQAGRQEHGPEQQAHAMAA